MKPLNPLSSPGLRGMALLPILFAGTAFAGEPASHAQAHAKAELSAMHAQDPMDKVYVITSRQTYDQVGTLVRDGVARSDSLGTQLVVSEIRAHNLAALSEHVHQRERRCGGYFAFATRSEAEAFLRNDRAGQAVRRMLLASYSIDNQATVGPWLSQAGSSTIQSTISHLQGYQNRYYTSATGKSSAEWIRTTWQGLANGRSDVSSELFACANCSTQPSVILTVRGTELPGEVVVLGAHLDSTSGGGGSGITAPGADDDASGIATLTEVIRVALANGWRPKRTVKFMGYAAEEVGLRGSNAIATSFRNAGTNVVGVLQLDMTNYQTGSATAMRLVTDYSNADLKTFFNQLFDAYLAPLGHTRGTYTCGYGCSDHASWTSAGYPSAMMFEAGSPGGGYNPNIHTTSDTLANMGNSAQASVKFAQFGLAFLGELAKTSGGGTPTNTPPVANFTSSASGLTVQFTDSSTDSDGTIASRSWTFGDGTTSTAASPSKTYSAAGTYTVTLTVTDDGGATNTRTSSVTVGGTGGTQTYSNPTDVNIPDNNATGVTSNITVSGRTGNAPTNASVSVNVVHPFKGDLIVDLVAPDGSVYNLHNRTGGSADNVVGTFSRNLSTEALNGVWKLRVRDLAAQDVGYINSWSVTF